MPPLISENVNPAFVASLDVYGNVSATYDFPVLGLLSVFPCSVIVTYAFPLTAPKSQVIVTVPLALTVPVPISRPPVAASYTFTVAPIGALLTSTLSDVPLLLVIVILFSDGAVLTGNGSATYDFPVPGLLSVFPTSVIVTYAFPLPAPTMSST